MAVGDAAKRLPRQQSTSRGDSARTHEASLRRALREVCGQQRTRSQGRSDGAVRPTSRRLSEDTGGREIGLGAAEGRPAVPPSF